MRNNHILSAKALPNVHLLSSGVTLAIHPNSLIDNKLQQQIRCRSVQMAHHLQYVLAAIQPIRKKLDRFTRIIGTDEHTQSPQHAKDRLDFFRISSSSNSRRSYPHRLFTSNTRGQQCRRCPHRQRIAVRKRIVQSRLAPHQKRLAKPHGVARSGPCQNTGPAPGRCGFAAIAHILGRLGRILHEQTAIYLEVTLDGKSVSHR